MAAAFTDSQHYDRILHACDIRASKAHARMLGKVGIISGEEADTLIAGLDRVGAEINSGQFVWKSELEDVHMNIEARLTELVGDVGKKLHTGRSRNDQVALTFRLYTAERCQAWMEGCHNLCRVLLEIASGHQNDILPGLTHLQPAQPVSLAQHMLAYAAMFRRDAERLADALKRIRVSPLGAAALAGSTYPLDPGMVARELGFPLVFSNSMDAVSDRDFVLEALFCASEIMMHLSRLSEEIIIWSGPAYGFIRLPDEFSTGSSIMPQKKNPDVAELVRGRCGRVYGHLVGLLTVMKGLPLTYNRDMQEDKEGFFDSDATVTTSLQIMAAMLAGITFNVKRMLEACKMGFLNATEFADYLAKKGIPFREAHHIAGRAVALAEERGCGLENLTFEELQALAPNLDRDIYDILEYGECARRRETPGGTGPEAVARQIVELNSWLANVSREKGKNRS